MELPGGKCHPLCSSLILASLVLLSLPEDSFAQEESREDDNVVRAFEHDGKVFGAYVDEKTGTPLWVLDIDSLDFDLGVKRSLTTETSVADASVAFLEAYADAFRIHPKDLVLQRCDFSNRCAHRRNYR